MKPTVIESRVLNVYGGALPLADIGLFHLCVLRRKEKGARGAKNDKNQFEFWPRIVR